MTHSDEFAKRQEILFNFYSAERRNGVDPLTANERMMEFAKRFDKRPQIWDATNEKWVTT